MSQLVKMGVNRSDLPIYPVYRTFHFQPMRLLEKSAHRERNENKRQWMDVLDFVEYYQVGGAVPG